MLYISDGFHRAVYRCLQIASLDHNWRIDVNELVIATRPRRNDSVSYFMFAEKVKHLVTNIRTHDDSDTFKLPLYPLHRESLVLELRFEVSVR
jgi:hypothetical protein